MKNLVLFLLFFFFFCEPLFAGGPIYISTAGEISHWDNTTTITFDMEDGTCGPYTNAEMADMLNEAFSAYENLEETDLDITLSTGDLPDVDGDNYQSYLVTGLASENDDLNASDGIIPIVFDNDAEITAALAGESNKFLFVGLASIHNSEDEELEVISDGQVIINCRCLAGHPIFDTCEVSGIDVVIDEESLQSTLVHEIGHLLNLDHSIANEEAFTNDDDDDDDLIPTMYPYVFTTLEPYSLSQDDIMAIGMIYPSDVMDEDYCLVTGTILNVDDEELQCANVIAKTSDDADTVSFVSGALDSSFSIQNNFIVLSEDCEDRCGDFQFYLEAGQDYTISVSSIDATLVGASAVGPCRTTQKSGIVDEDNLATVSSSQCTSGSTVALGSLSTSSTAAGVTSTDTESTGDDSTDETSTGGTGGGGDSSDYDNPLGYGCSLNSQSSTPSQHLYFSFVMIFLLIVFTRISLRKISKN